MNTNKVKSKKTYFVKTELKLFLTIFTLVIFGLSSAFAQSFDSLNSQMNKIANPESVPDWIRFKDGTNINPKTIFIIYKSAFNLQKNDKMLLTKVENDEFGLSHYRYQQFYKNVKVEGSEYIVHVNKSGFAYAANGKIEMGLNNNVTQTLSKEQIIGFTLKYVNAKEYSWQSPFLENELKERSGKSDTSYFPVPQLIIYNITPDLKTFDKDNIVLAYRLDIYSSSPNKSQRIFINAKTGEIINDIPLEANCSSSSFSTAFNGTRTINTDLYTSNYRLKDNCQSATIRIRDWNSTTSTSNNPLEIISSNNTWTTTNQRFGGSVLWATKQAYNYFLNVHSRSSYNNANGNVEGYVNAYFDYPGGGYYTDNASMSFTGGILKVGLGSSGTLSNSWCPLDVMCHEYAHAVTGSSAQLNYQYESGALNESFSDIFGEMGENYTLGNNDWLIGADRASGAIRSMSNPNAYGQPDTYLGTYWYIGTGDNGGVHTNSGVQNFWFYLLTNGGSGINDNGYSYSVNGLGIIKARAIAYRNLTVYLTSNSDYNSAYLGSINAAIDLYGGGSAEVSAVIAAWCAVGIGTSCNHPLCNNDNSCSPMTLSINTSGNCVTTNCSTINATTQSPDIPFYGSATCTSLYQSGRYDDDVWFSITTTNSNPITINVTPTSNLNNFDPVIGLYQGSCSNPTQVTCAALNGVGQPENLIFSPPAGTNTYLVRVFSYGIGSTFSGNFSICAFQNAAATATITNFTISPSIVCSGGTFTITNTVNASAAINNVILGASIAPTGTTNYINNTSNDLPVSLPSGTSTQTRIFTVPPGTTNGTYDVVSGLWKDNNSNGIIDAGDVLLNSLTRVGLLTVSGSLPSQPSVISGSTNSCLGSQSYSVTNVSGVTYTWSLSGGGTITGSGNPATVNWTNPGTWTITVTPSNNCGPGTPRTLSVTVNPNVSAGTVSGTSPLCIGATATYNSNGTAGGTWGSSNPSVATVNASTGLVTAMSVGTATITYTVNSGCGSPVSATKIVTVIPNITAGTVSGTSPLCIGNTATYTSNGTAGGTWSSSNSLVATVNPSSGLVTAVSAGTTNIIYTVIGCNGTPLSAQSSLTVSSNVSAGTVSGTSPLCIGSTATYTSNGTGGGIWSSSNTNVATVNVNTGLVTAVNVGTTNITYTVSNGCGSPISSFMTLSVSPNVSAGTVSGTSPLCVSNTATYTNNGTTGGTWSSSNSSVATVSASTGLVTAIAAGTANITYTLNSGCGSPVSSFKILTVTPTITAGTVSGTSPLCSGNTATYTSNGTAGGTWSSSNTNVATVNASTGLVTATGVGTTNIVYTITGCNNTSLTASITLTVNPNVSAGTVGGTSPLCIGATATYTSNGTAGGTWSSSNPPVATVNTSTGLVTTVSAGTTNIIYTLVTACSGIPLTASKTLTVSSNNTPGITISQSSCIVDTVIFNSTITNGGISPTYLWTFSSGTAVGGINGPSLTLKSAANGTQVQCVLLSNAVCVFPAQITSVPLIINCTTNGINNINGLLEFKIIPNPNNGIFQVKMKLSSIKDVDFKIYNNLGQLVYITENYRFSGSFTKDFTLTNLSHGVYSLQTTIGSESFTVNIVMN